MDPGFNFNIQDQYKCTDAQQNNHSPCQNNYKNVCGSSWDGDSGYPGKSTETSLDACEKKCNDHGFICLGFTYLDTTTVNIDGTEISWNRKYTFQINLEIDLKIH